MTARYVFPVSGPPLAGGMLSIAGQRLVAVSSRRSPEAIDLGDVAIIPGLVNAHVHLEFSLLGSPVGQPGMEFTDLDSAGHRPPPLFAAADPAAIVEAAWPSALQPAPRRSARSAPIAIFPIRAFRLPTDRLCRSHLPRPAANTDGALEAAAVARQVWRPAEHCRPGISPHAPYTVHARIARTMDRAGCRNQRAAGHAPGRVGRPSWSCWRLAAGRFARCWKNWACGSRTRSAPPVRPLDYLRALARAPRSLVIHGNYLDQARDRALSPTTGDRMAVVYCPRTHAFFGHPPHPLPRLLQAGAAVALGTDGRSSNPDLSLLADVRFAAGRFAGIEPERFLQMATLDGAAALGLDRDTGSLEPANLRTLPAYVCPPGSPADPHEALVDRRRAGRGDHVSRPLGLDGGRNRRHHGERRC